MFLSNFVNVSIDFADWNVHKGLPAKILLSSMLRINIIAVFQLKMSGIDIGKDNNSKIFRILPLLLNLCQTVDRCLVL